MTFKNNKVALSFSHYLANFQNSLLITSLHGERLNVASICLADETLKDDEIAIKNYSENDGVLDFLVQEKIISTPIRTVKSGYVEIPICKILTPLCKIV